MRKKQTPGERVVDNLDIGEPGWRIKLERTIDRAIRKAQAEAWLAGIQFMHERPLDGMAQLDGSGDASDNPYRGRRRK